MKHILLILSMVVAFSINAQEYLMQNGSIVSCSGTFYDTGGDLLNYSNNENFVFTICPENPGERISLDFQSFDLQANGDFMNIYDGQSTSDLWFGSFTGNSNWPNITATLNNPTGCLTIEFISDGTVTNSGWEASISCTTPCQNIEAVLDSIFPLSNEEGIVEVCVGENITLSGSGIFENDGIGASYTWDLGNGTAVDGQTVNISYDEPGVYLVNLDIRDTNTDNYIGGCPNTNAINQVIRVSGMPDFTGTQAVDDTLCFGDSTVILGDAIPNTLLYNCPPPESDETFLPDGNGAAYFTCINVTCFEPDAVLTDASQIFDICLNIEHSYSGDLDIKIISPSGQEAYLFTQAGGGTYFGAANDDNTNAPGVGADYCFSMTASTLLANANTIVAGSTPPGNSWEPGTYLPVESFNALIGSPLNGEWCIEIIDNLAIDNGYIFSWELNFDESVPQEDFSFVPAIISESWDTDVSITQVNGNSITVAPSTSGIHCYTYRVMDEFGCEFTEEVCITVAEESQPPITYYEDSDGDGFGDADSSVQECSNVPPIGYVANDLDCDDSNNLINPDGTDSVGNGIDENCDGVDGDLLSVDDLLDQNLIIHPNPFNDTITIDLPQQFNNQDISITIFDIHGRVFFNKTYSVMDGEINIEHLNTLEKAPYFLKLSSKDMQLSIVKKLIRL
ncbi:T9SS type A sorting domain-containing protein [Psychroserpens sp. BH13MA-6]